MQQSSAKAPTPTRTPQPQPQAGPPKPNYDVFAAFSSARPTSQSSTPAPSLLQQQQQQQQQQQLQQATKPQGPSPSDPFDILSSAPQQTPAFTPNPGPTPNPLYNPASALQYSNTATNRTTNGALAEDDWNFSSALPEDSLPTSSSLIVSNKEIGIVFDVQRRAGEEAIVHVLAKFSNKSPIPITEYTFQVAVTKVSSHPQSPLSQSTSL